MVERIKHIESIESLKYIAMDCLETILANPMNEKNPEYIEEMTACINRLIEIKTKESN